MVADIRQSCNLFSGVKLKSSIAIYGNFKLKKRHVIRSNLEDGTDNKAKIVNQYLLQSNNRELKMRHVMTISLECGS